MNYLIITFFSIFTVNAFAFDINQYNVKDTSFLDSGEYCPAGECHTDFARYYTNTNSIENAIIITPMPNYTCLESACVFNDLQTIATKVNSKAERAIVEFKNSLGVQTMEFDCTLHTSGYDISEKNPQLYCAKYIDGNRSVSLWYRLQAK
jgi:hypothetical protein